MAALRHGHGNRSSPAVSTSMVTEAPDSPTSMRKTRFFSKGGVLSAAVAEHYNRTNPPEHDHHSARSYSGMSGGTDRVSDVSDVPWWVSHPVFKGLVVTGLIMGALSPVLLKVGRADSEQRRRREHNDSFRKENPEVTKLGEYQQNNYYCHAPFPGALDSVAYKHPHGSELRAIQIITRNGDRAPCGVLPFENNVTWNCDAPDLYDPSGTPIEVTRVRDEPSSLPSQLWNGNCWRCDITGRGMAQQHMLGQALGDIYGELLEMSPANLYVRSVDSDAIQRGVKGMVRGLLTNAIDGGAVHIASGLSREEDVLLPRLSACPRLAELWSFLHHDSKWESFKTKNLHLMEQLMEIMSSTGFEADDEAMESKEGDDDNENGDEKKEIDATMEAFINGGQTEEGMMTGAKLPESWEARFDLFLDTVRTRTCNGIPLPCSPRDPSRCVFESQAHKLFSAGDWSFRHKYTFQREETATLYAGPLLALLLKNLGKFMSEHEAVLDGESQAPPITESVQVYAGEVDTVGGILAALNVTDWAWPPYASNLVFELWKRTATESLPRVEGGQVETELFVRMLYNGRVVRPSFCQREECPLRTYKSHVMQFLVPQDLKAACSLRHPEALTSASNDVAPSSSSTNTIAGRALLMEEKVASAADKAQDEREKATSQPEDDHDDNDHDIGHGKQ